MAQIIWDEEGTRFYENGTDHGVLYPKDTDTGKYTPGVAWNGLTAVGEKPSGAEETKLFADNIKYGSLMSAEEFAATIEAYTYPDAWEECDGSKSPVPGMSIGQQTRKTFGLSYRTKIGNDISDDIGYKLHLVYGAKASPSEKSYATVNDSPEAMTMSWEVTTTPVAVTDAKPTAIVTIDSTKVAKPGLAALEAVLYGSGETEAELPLPDAVKTLLMSAG